MEVITCSKHNYSGINNLCPECEVEKGGTCPEKTKKDIKRRNASIKEAFKIMKIYARELYSSGNVKRAMIVLESANSLKKELE